MNSPLNFDAECRMREARFWLAPKFVRLPVSNPAPTSTRASVTAAVVVAGEPAAAAAFSFVGERCSGFPLSPSQAARLPDVGPAGNVDVTVALSIADLDARAVAAIENSITLRIVAESESVSKSTSLFSR